MIYSYRIHIPSFLHQDYFTEDEIIIDYLSEEDRKKLHEAVLTVNEMISHQKIKMKKRQRDEEIIEVYKFIKSNINNPKEIKKILEELYDKNV